MTIARRVAGATTCALLIAACGSTGDGSTAPTAVRIPATSYVTLPPPPSTVPYTGPSTTLPLGEQAYEVATGDYPASIANRHGVSLQALMEINEWVFDPKNPNQVLNFPPVGTEIRIPPGGRAPSTATTPPPPSTDATGVTVATPTTPKCPPRSYTILAADTTRLGVAQKFGVTVAAMDAANVGTRGYSSFYPGLTIVIPPADKC